MTDDQTAKCARCERPMRHDTALVCSNCAAHLRRQLELVAKIAGDITLTVAKLSRVRTAGSGQPDELGWWKAANALEPVPLIVDLDRADRHDAAVNALSGWCRLIAEERGVLTPKLARLVNGMRPGVDYHPLEAIATYLIAHLEWLRHHPAADEAWLDLLTACAQLERVVDTFVDDRDTVGLCACGTARHDGQERCNRCGATEIATSRAELDKAQHEYAVTASEAAVWIADMGLVADTRKLRDMIYKWRDRGFLHPVDETPRYRFGDVLRRVLDSPALLRVA